MTDKKLTDNEIIKALKCCADHDNIDACDDCPCQKGKCISTTPYVLDLINRLQAENENFSIELQAMRNAANGFKAENKRLRNAYKQCAWERDVFVEKSISAKYPYCVWIDENLILSKNEQGYNKLIANIKAEAYKECIDMVKKKGINIGVGEIFITTNTLDNLLKELVGENNE